MVKQALIDKDLHNTAFSSDFGIYNRYKNTLLTISQQTIQTFTCEQPDKDGAHHHDNENICVFAGVHPEWYEVVGDGPHMEEVEEHEGQDGEEERSRRRTS